MRFRFPGSRRFRVNAGPLITRPSIDGRQSAPEAITELADPLGVLLHCVDAEPEGCGDANHTGRVHGAAASTALLAATNDLGSQSHATIGAADQKDACPFWAVKFVGGRAEQVDTDRLHVDRNPAHGLGRVTVQQRAVPITDLRHFLHRCDRTDLIVGPHHRHHRRVVIDRVGQPIQVDGAASSWPWESPEHG